MDQERLERFVRESPWEHASVETQLQETVPEPVQGDDAAIIVDGMGIPDEVGYQSKHDIATGLIEQAVGAGLDHACVVGDTNFGKRTSFREDLRALGEPYVLEIETQNSRVVPEDTPVIEPGPTDGRGPPRKYPAYPADIDGKTAAEVADAVGDQEAWTRGPRRN